MNNLTAMLLKLMPHAFHMPHSLNEEMSEMQSELVFHTSVAFICQSHSISILDQISSHILSNTPLSDFHHYFCPFHCILGKKISCLNLNSHSNPSVISPFPCSTFPRHFSRLLMPIFYNSFATCLSDPLYQDIYFTTKLLSSDPYKLQLLNAMASRFNKLLLSLLSWFLPFHLTSQRSVPESIICNSSLPHLQLLPW